LWIIINGIGMFTKPIESYNQTQARYFRALEYLEVKRFVGGGGQDMGKSWTIHENMTLREARERYYAWQGYAEPLAMALINYVCDGTEAPEHSVTYGGTFYKD
jgi:hypothetical protein